MAGLAATQKINEITPSVPRMASDVLARCLLITINMSHLVTTGEFGLKQQLTDQYHVLVETAAQLPLRGWLPLRDWMMVPLSLTLVLNLMDAMLTLFWVHTGMAVEANPLMDILLHHGSVPFMLGKLCLVSLGTYFIWCFRHHRLAIVGAITSCAAYMVVCLWHFYGIIQQ